MPATRDQIMVRSDETLYGLSYGKKLSTSGIVSLRVCDAKCRIHTLMCLRLHDLGTAQGCAWRCCTYHMDAEDIRTVVVVTLAPPGFAIDEGQLK